jgi:hypothetical protein
MMERKLIRVKHSVRLKLMRIHNCTYPTVRKALKYECDSELSQRLRISAIEQGGEIFTLNK